MATDIIFPITENGIKKMYITDADYKTLSDYFFKSSNYEELKERLEILGYSISEYRPSIAFNFDEIN